MNQVRRGDTSVRPTYRRCFCRSTRHRRPQMWHLQRLHQSLTKNTNKRRIFTQRYHSAVEFWICTTRFVAYPTAHITNTTQSRTQTNQFVHEAIRLTKCTTHSRVSSSDCLSSAFIFDIKSKRIVQVWDDLQCNFCMLPEMG